MQIKDSKIQISSFTTRSLFSWLAWRSGLAELARRIMVRDGQFVLAFHGVARQRYPDFPASLQPHHTVADLQFTLDWLARHFTFLSPQAFFDGAPGVLLTFDDGFANHASNALPVLEAFNAPAIFFVTTQHVQDPRNWLYFIRSLVNKHFGESKALPSLDMQAADCLDGMSEAQLLTCSEHPLVTIGAHSVTHPLLPQCSPADMRRELIDSRTCLKTLTGQAIDLFAYPVGAYNPAVVQAVQEAGYRAAFALDSWRVASPQYEIPRVGLYYSDEPYLALKLSGLHRRPIHIREA